MLTGSGRGLQLAYDPIIDLRHVLVFENNAAAGGRGTRAGSRFAGGELVCGAASRLAAAAPAGFWVAGLPAGGRPRARLLWQHTKAAANLLGPSARLLFQIENHTYAYSVAASVILAFLPFLLLQVTIARMFQSVASVKVIYEVVRDYLPAGQGLIIKDLAYLSQHHKHAVQAVSLLMLGISSTGVFLPLEVALNGIWGFPRNRSYVRNQAVSLGLVAVCGALAYLSVALTAGGQELASGLLHFLLPSAWTDVLHVSYSVLAWGIMRLCVVPATILGFFLIYWWLPNGPVPAVQVFPAAFYAGLLAEIFRTVFRWLLPLLDFKSVYADFALPVTLIIWGFAGALLLLFGASLSARGIARMPAHLRMNLHWRPGMPHHRRSGQEEN